MGPYYEVFNVSVRDSDKTVAVGPLLTAKFSAIMGLSQYEEAP